MSQSDYGKAGLLGMLTPQANTTVEPEFWSLLPPGWSIVNARLTSAKSTIEERLVDYAECFDESCAQFTNVPLSVLAIGCTGASYLIGPAREAEIVVGIEARRKVRCFTAALAVVAALKALGAERIALVSPYSGALDQACVPYWEQHGFSVVGKTGPSAESDKFHPIYAMPGTGALAALRTFESADCDAVVMLGTGMPTLMPLLAVRGWDGPIALSCNLALAWACVEGARRGPMDKASLQSWIAGTHWGARYLTLFPGHGAQAHER